MDGLGWRRAFDRVYAQMMPSFREAADFARFEACSRGWCVFIGWGRERHDAWLQAAFAAHGVPWEVPAGVPLAAAQLQTLGRQPVPVYWRETWQRRRTLEQAMADAAVAAAAGHKPMARLVSYAIAGVPNEIMGEGCLLYTSRCV